jgi:hypothetical protein
MASKSLPKTVRTLLAFELFVGHRVEQAIELVL